MRGNSSRPRNFSAGPAILPAPVFERVSAAVRRLSDGGFEGDDPEHALSILEISHRSPAFDAIHEGVIALCHEVLGIPRSHRVLLLQGGASLQFCMVPLNLLRPAGVACYIDTGAWSKKAISEAKLVGETRVVASSADTHYDRIPQLPPADAYAGAEYLHITSNNTIFGTEYPALPRLTGDVPLVVDCSSNIGSKPMDFDRVGLGYAGAQKNLGPSGVTLVFVREDLLPCRREGVSHFLRYETHAQANSLYNTPNTFGILVLHCVLEWMREQGGVDAIAAVNARKAGKIYDVLESSALYRPHAQATSRSQMNVTWTLVGKDEGEGKALTQRFVAEAEAAGLNGLKGHRSVGGCRASIYNAFPEEGVDELVEFMREFERRA